MFLEKVLQSGAYAINNNQLQSACKKCTFEDWILENKWLQKQPLAAQYMVLIKMHEWDIPFSKIEVPILTDIIYSYIKTETKKDTWNTFRLPIRAYNQILEKLYASDCLHTDTLIQATKNVFRNVIQMMLFSQHIFQRGQLLFFYESLYNLSHNLSQKGGSALFKTLVVGLSFIPTFLRESAISGYKLSVFKRVHKTILVNLFRALCVFGHVRDIDVLFHYHRLVLRGRVQKWMLSLDEVDVDVVWSYCPYIQKFCLDNSLKWKQIRTDDTPIWHKCKEHLSDDILTIENTMEFTDDQLCALAENNVQKLHQILQKFSTDVQRNIFMTALQNEHYMSTSYHDVPFLKLYLLRYQRVCLNKCDHHPLLMDFYCNQGNDPHTLLTSMVRVSSVSDKHLKQWCDAYGNIPVSFVVYILKRITTLLKIQQKKIHTLSNEPIRILTNLNTILEKIFKHGLKDDEHTQDIDHATQHLFKFLQTFQEYLSVFRPPFLLKCAQRFVCCIYMDTLDTFCQPSADAFQQMCDSQDCCASAMCAICYNEVQQPLKRLPCGHTFHKECILHMIHHASHTVNKNQDGVFKCPYCMSKILTGGTISQALSDVHTRAVSRWIIDV